ncbi:MAG: toxic anion resistance protein [Bacillota bacterium]|nr:toxic anion resistance protein [Bacillota bacterium]
MAQQISLDDLIRGREREQGATELQTTTDESMLAVPDSRELSAEDRAQVDKIKNGIDLLDSAALVSYGVGAQQELTSFADTILQKVRSKDAGQVGETLSNLMVNVQSLEVDKIGGGSSFWNRLPFTNNIKRFMARYDTIEGQIEKIETELETSRVSLLRDISIFDTLYQRNLDYFRQLDLLIVAGDEKIREAREETLPALRAEAAATGEGMHAQLVRDFEDTISRFEKKVHDLKLSKTIAIQTAPQIRLIQNNDKQLVDKIQTAILNTLPLWKNQIVIALGLQNQRKVLEMQQQISQTTNDLLRQNAELLKTNTIETARESEKGIVEIETLKKVNQDLIETINETIKIQQEGRLARQKAELELVTVENELKRTLLSHAQPTTAPAGPQGE